MGDEWMWLWNSGGMITNRQTEEVVQNLVSVTIWPLQIPHGLLLDRLHTSWVTEQSQTSEYRSHSLMWVMWWRKWYWKVRLDYLLC